MIPRRNGPHAILITLLALGLSGCQQLGSLWNKTPSKEAPARAAQSTAGLEWTGPVKPEQKADVQMAVARSLENQGQTDQAIKVYLEVVKKDNRRVDACHRLALLYDKKGDGESARTYYQIALKKDPKNANLLCDFGYSCYLRKQWADAETGFRRAIALDPNHARAHNNLGLLLARTNRPSEALQEFAKAGCTEAPARSNLAFALSLEGRLPEAEKQFELALAADPNLKTAREGLARLRSARATGDTSGVAVAEDPSGRGVAATAYLTSPTTHRVQH